MPGTSPLSDYYRILAALAACMFWLTPVAATENPAGENQETRRSITERYDAGGRERSSLQSTTEDRYDALIAEGQRKKPSSRIEDRTEVQENDKEMSATARAMSAVRHDFWFHYADVLLFNDDDNDGYYHGIDVLFDVDTWYSVADVYAVLYLSLEGGPWNEYAVTDTFSVFGATSDDEFVVVTELLSGYPTGYYDLLIEIYDALDGTFLVEMGPADNPDFADLPLEDFHRDDPRRSPGRRSGGGALDWMSLLLFSALLLYWRSA